MTRCPGCGFENRAGVHFCEECGAKLERICPACGAAIPPGRKFCGSCGQALAPTPPAVQRFGSPESYTPKHLAEKILTSKAAFEGERKQVTVLFADLKGSMELLADRDPEEARKLLDPILERMMEAVHRYEGTVNQVMGDGIMALFGAPLAHEDHAVRACYAALAMQAAIRSYAQELRRSHGLEVQIRVGLNSGDVIVRSIGSDLHMDYTAVGQTTHLAGRMEQIATPGTVRLTAATLRLAEGFVQVTPLGPMPVKGLGETVDVFELVGTGASRTRLQAAASRGLTRFVGRQTELDELHQALQKASTGHGQVVAVVGEPGVGKSRLLWEFTRSRQTQGWLIVESGSISYGKATAYLPVTGLLKAYFQIQDRDNHRTIFEKVSGKLLALDPVLMPTLPAFFTLLDVPVEDPRWQDLDPPQRRQRTLEACKRLLLRESQVQPLLLVFEDLHWIDSETQAILDSLIGSLPTAQLLLLISYRPEYQHPWGGKTYYTQLRIDPLPPETAEEFLQTLLGRDTNLNPLKQHLINSTEGNPFFLEESVRILMEAKVLVSERGAYRLVKPLQTIEVPATVQAVLAARIDRLPPEEKRLLQSASVIGKDVPFTVLQAIAELQEGELRSGLAHLQAAEFLYELSLYPESEYTFKHALTHEVAYNTLLQDRRRALHARIVDAFEALYSERAAEIVERLAHHALRGEVWEKAVQYLRRAGAKAFAQSANRESANFFEQALAALNHLAETRETLEQAIDLRVDLRNSLVALGEIEKAFGYLRDAERVARMLDDPRRLAQVSIPISHYLLTTGHLTEACRFAQSAHAIAETLGDLPLEIESNYMLGAALHALGDCRGSEDCLRRNVQLIQGDLTRVRSGLTGFPSVLSRVWLTLSLADRGVFHEGIAYGQEAMRIAEELDHPYSLIFACWGLAYLYGVKGESSEAIRLSERGRALSRDWNVSILSPLVTGQLGYAYALSGRVAEGLELLDQAMKAHEAIALAAFHSKVIVQVGEVCMLADRPEDALAFAGRALTLARDRGERNWEAWAHRLLGDITARPDSPDVATAEGHYGQAMTEAHQLGLRPLIARCHLGLGTLYRHTAKRQPAHEHLTTATTMFHEMEMEFWLEKAKAELGPLG